MTIERNHRRGRHRCADATVPRGEQAHPTSPGYHLVRLLSTWPGTLRLLLVLVGAVTLLVTMMIIAPVQVDLGPLQVAPAAVS